MPGQDVALQHEKRAAGQSASSVITVSVDEKPGVHAIANTAPDLQPAPGKHPKIGRDRENQRLGTCSILAAVTAPQARLGRLHSYMPREGSCHLAK